MLVLNIFWTFVESYVEHLWIVKIKFLIIVEQFVKQRRDRREKRKKPKKFKKISNVKKLRKYKRLLTLILERK